MMISQNQTAFLNTIAFSELGDDLIKSSDNGYNVLVGSTAQHPLLFNDYSDHPRVLNRQLNSTAAGRYQILAHWFDAYKAFLCVQDFSPPSQDAIALQMIKEASAIPNIDAGRVHIAIAQCAHLWASLPGAGYHQHEQSCDSLYKYFQSVGGKVIA